MINKQINERTFKWVWVQNVMDLFENTINKEKFQSTNNLWNELMLNTGWSVGYVSNIIKNEKSETKEKWKEYYLNSGIERMDKLKQLPIEEQKILNNITQNNYNGANKYLNLNYGRTREEIAGKGSILYRKTVELGNPLDINEQECMLMAYFRVVCETWNGIKVREGNTKKSIEKYFENKGKRISLIDTSGEFDCSFGVDFEIYYEGTIKCGLQIKPPTYNSNKSYLKIAKNINENKNAKYKEQFNRDVFYVYAKASGDICNKEILTSLDDILSI